MPVRATSALAVGRMRQQRLLLLWIRFRDQRAAMAVGHGDKASGHVIAEECESGGMATVSHHQGAAPASAVLRIGKRRLRAEGDVRKIDAAMRVEGRGCTGVDAAAVDHPRIPDDGAADPGTDPRGADKKITCRIGADEIDCSDNLARRWR
jgi:hypothetical protein